MDLGCEVWESIVTRDTTTDELKEYNSKSLEEILNVLSYFVKGNVGQCSLAKIFWEKLQKLYEESGFLPIES